MSGDSGSSSRGSGRVLQQSTRGSFIGLATRYIAAALPLFLSSEQQQPKSHSERQHGAVQIASRPDDSMPTPDDGDALRQANDYPEDAEGLDLSGRVRGGDKQDEQQVVSDDPPAETTADMDTDVHGAGEAEEEYIAEVVLEQRMTSWNEVQYLVRYKGYPEPEWQGWEAGFAELVTEYEEKTVRDATRLVNADMKLTPATPPADGKTVYATEPMSETIFDELELQVVTFMQENDNDGMDHIMQNVYLPAVKEAIRLNTADKDGVPAQLIDRDAQNLVLTRMEEKWRQFPAAAVAMMREEKNAENGLMAQVRAVLMQGPATIFGQEIANLDRADVSCACTLLRVIASPADMPAEQEPTRQQSMTGGSQQWKGFNPMSARMSMSANSNAKLTVSSDFLKILLSTSMESPSKADMLQLQLKLAGFLEPNTHFTKTATVTDNVFQALYIEAAIGILKCAVKKDTANAPPSMVTNDGPPYYFVPKNVRRDRKAGDKAGETMTVQMLREMVMNTSEEALMNTEIDAQLVRGEKALGQRLRGSMAIREALDLDMQMKKTFQSINGALVTAAFVSNHYRCCLRNTAATQLQKTSQHLQIGGEMREETAQQADNLTEPRQGSIDTCEICRSTEHSTPLCPDEGKICERCGETSHVESACPERIQIEETGCDNCGGFGHAAKGCPKPQKVGSSPGAPGAGQNGALVKKKPAQKPPQKKPNAKAPVKPSAAGWNASKTASIVKRTGVQVLKSAEIDKLYRPVENVSMSVTFGAPSKGRVRGPGDTAWNGRKVSMGVKPDQAAVRKRVEAEIKKLGGKWAELDRGRGNWNLADVFVCKAGQGTCIIFFHDEEQKQAVIEAGIFPIGCVSTGIKKHRPGDTGCYEVSLSAVREIEDGEQDIVTYVFNDFIDTCSIGNVPAILHALDRLFCNGKYSPTADWASVRPADIPNLLQKDATPMTPGDYEFVSFQTEVGENAALAQQSDARVKVKVRFLNGKIPKVTQLCDYMDASNSSNRFKPRRTRVVVKITRAGQTTLEPKWVNIEVPIEAQSITVNAYARTSRVDYSETQIVGGITALKKKPAELIETRISVRRLQEQAERIVKNGNQVSSDRLFMSQSIGHLGLYAPSHPSLDVPRLAAVITAFFKNEDNHALIEEVLQAPVQAAKTPAHKDEVATLAKQKSAPKLSTSSSSSSKTKPEFGEFKRVGAVKAQDNFLADFEIPASLVDKAESERTHAVNEQWIQEVEDPSFTRLGFKGQLKCIEQRFYDVVYVILRDNVEEDGFTEVPKKSVGENAASKRGRLQHKAQRIAANLLHKIEAVISADTAQKKQMMFRCVILQILVNRDSVSDVGMRGVVIQMSGHKDEAISTEKSKKVKKQTDIVEVEGRMKALAELVKGGSENMSEVGRAAANAECVMILAECKRIYSVKVDAEIIGESTPTHRFTKRSQYRYCERIPGSK